VSSTASVNGVTGTTGFLTGNVFEFRGEGGHQPALTYELAAAGPALVKIFDATDTLVRTISVSGTAGTNVTAWDGKNDAGLRLTAGAYSFVVTDAGGAV